MTDVTQIYHLAPADRWLHWPDSSPYLPAEYAADGFVHCTAGAARMIEVANRFYHDRADAFVVLVLELERLSAPIRWEQPPDDITLFPHLYGPIDRDAVVAVHQVRRAADGTFIGW